MPSAPPPDPVVAVLQEYFRTTRLLIELLGATHPQAEVSAQKFAAFNPLSMAADLSAFTATQEGEKDYTRAKSRLKAALANGGAPEPINDDSDASTLIGNDDVLLSIINNEFFPGSFRYQQGYLHNASLVSQIALKITKIS